MQALVSHSGAEADLRKSPAGGPQSENLMKTGLLILGTTLFWHFPHDLATKKLFIKVPAHSD
jgi:hypothetical protein